MSVPPEFITVKRKRDAETPLHILRLESNKRHRSDDFVYQRRIEEPRSTATSVLPQNVTKPVIHISEDGDENRPTRQIKTAKKPCSPTNPGPNGPTPPSQQSEAQRRFFLKRTREDIERDKRSDDNVSRQYSGILFVERCHKKLKAVSKIDQSHQTPLSTGKALPVAQEINEQPGRKFKKPGVTRRAVSSQNSTLPKVLLPAETPSEDNIIRLQEWALQETEAAKPGRRRFKPKPCMRFADRHPNYKPDLTKEEADVEMDYYESEDSEASYVTETYVRVPAHLVKNKSDFLTGMLVLQDESDIEFFYEKDAESDADFDDDDSNDENYYANDYPDDEEVAWSGDDELEEPLQALRKEQVGSDSDDDEDDDAEDRHLRENPWTEMYM